MAAVRTAGLSIRSIVADGVNGMLVPVEDIEAAAQAIQALARDPRARMRMGQAGRARFEERFPVDKVTASVLEVYPRLQCPGAPVAELATA